MSSPIQPRLRSPRTSAVKRWLVAAAAMAATAVVAPSAQAADPLDVDPEITSADRTSFGMRRLRWSAAPVLHLQPERARVMLNLPSEWMPAQDVGFFAARGVSLVPEKAFEFRRDNLTTQAVIGPNVLLRIEDRAHFVSFGLRLMPRSAVAVLRFDPLAGLL